MGHDPAHDPTVLPPGLPVPVDDGAAAHLLGSALPRVPLLSTSGRWVNLGFLTKPAVLFFYPRTGVPGQPPSLGFQGEEWDSIAGARGCTPQSCGFRDRYAEIQALGVEVFGVSTSTTAHQREFVSRARIPFEMLSDADLALTRAMRLPTFEFPVEGGGPTTLIRRMGWYVSAGGGGSPPPPPRIAHVWYPVFPPDGHAAAVLEWLRAARGAGRVGSAEASEASRASAGVEVRAGVAGDAAYVRERLSRHWLSTTIWSRDVRYEADRIPSLVAWRGGVRVGLLTYAEAPDGLEVVTLSSDTENAGVGSALMDAVERIARERSPQRVRRVVLTTSNDNLRALRFYQRRGYRLVAVHRGMMDRYRQREKAIPLIGMNGIPLHDEIELEKGVDS